MDLELKDYSHLSKNDICDKVSDFLQDKIRVFCDLCDRDGCINEEILKVINNYNSETSILYLKNGEKTFLYDSCLYNLTYKKKYYSLTIQDEYYEKILIDK